FASWLPPMTGSRDASAKHSVNGAADGAPVQRRTRAAVSAIAAAAAKQVAGPTVVEPLQRATRSSRERFGFASDTCVKHAEYAVARSVAALSDVPTSPRVATLHAAPLAVTARSTDRRRANDPMTPVFDMGQGVTCPYSAARTRCKGGGTQQIAARRDAQ